MKNLIEILNSYEKRFVRMDESDINKLLELLNRVTMLEVLTMYNDNFDRKERWNKVVYPAQGLRGRIESAIKMLTK